MAYHARKLIREKIKQYLSVIPKIGQNIFFDDPDVIQADQVPCIFISSDTEQVDYTNVSSGTRTQQRKYQLSIVAFIKSNNSLSDKLDELSYNIELALAETREKTKLDGLVIMNNLISTDFEYSDDPELNIGSLRLVYEITYRTLENQVNNTI